MLSEAERDAPEESGKGTRPYHKTVVVVNELSARVTQGVPINNTLSQEMHQRKAERHTLCASLMLTGRKVLCDPARGRGAVGTVALFGVPEAYRRGAARQPR